MSQRDDAATKDVTEEIVVTKPETLAEVDEFTKREVDDECACGKHRSEHGSCGRPSLAE